MAQDNERFKWRQDPATGQWTLPKAGDQTVKKHDLYAEYLKEYLRIVGEGAWKSKRVRVTVIDAFAGGGEYDAEDAGRSLVPGSPLRLLRAAEEAKQALLERDPSYDVEVRFWFNDAERDNADHLRQVLGREGYTIDGKRIRVTTGRFADQVDAMIAAVRQQQPRAGKALVIADQTGWKDATPEMLSRFMDALPGVELLVTLSAGMLLNPGRGLNWNLVLSTRTWLHPQVIQQFKADVQQIRQEPDHQIAKSSRAVALRQVMSEMAVRTGATLFSAFTLVPERSNQYLWVLHMVRMREGQERGKIRARDAMLDTEWSLDGVTRHLGGTPRHYLGYKALRRSDNIATLDDLALAEAERSDLRRRFGRETVEALLSQMQEEHMGGVPVRDLLRATDNSTALTRDDRLRGLTGSLKEEGEGRQAVMVRPEGGDGLLVPVSGHRILRPDDLLVPPAQRVFIFP